MAASGSAHGQPTLMSPAGAAATAHAQAVQAWGRLQLDTLPYPWERNCRQMAASGSAHGQPPLMSPAAAAATPHAQAVQAWGSLRLEILPAPTCPAHTAAAVVANFDDARCSEDSTQHYPPTALIRRTSPRLLQVSYSLGRAMGAPGTTLSQSSGSLQPAVATSDCNTQPANAAKQAEQPLLLALCTVLHRDPAMYASLHANSWIPLTWELAGHLVAAAMVVIYGFGTHFRQHATVALGIYLCGHLLLTLAGGPYRAHRSIRPLHLALFNLSSATIIISWGYLSLRFALASQQDFPFKSPFIYTLAAFVPVRTSIMLVPLWLQCSLLLYMAGFHPGLRVGAIVICGWLTFGSTCFKVLQPKSTTLAACTQTGAALTPLFAWPGGTGTELGLTGGCYREEQGLGVLYIACSTIRWGAVFSRLKHGMQMFYWVGLSELQEEIVASNRQVKPLALLFVAFLTTLKMQDVFTDAGVAAWVYRQYSAGQCQWNGQEQRCGIFLRHFALITGSSCLALSAVLLMKMLPTFSRSAHSRPVLIALHFVSLLCETCTLTVTGMQLAAAGGNFSAGSTLGLAYQSVLFVLLSGCLTFAMFTLTVHSLYRSWTAEATAARVVSSMRSVHPEPAPPPTLV